MKKLLSIILAGSMLFGLAACGGSSESKDDNSDKKSSSDIVEDNGDVVGENDEFDAEDKGDSNADFSGTQVGDYITFGSYEQDNDLSNGKEPIEWLVLDEQDGRILVISKYALDSKSYHEERVDVTWETCTLRSWLNDEFINEAFMSGERAKIPVVTVTADGNPDWVTDPGNDTYDRVFLLSINEANEYFGSDSERECKATDYVMATGTLVSDYEGYEGNCWWWLRSSGCTQDFAARIVSEGYVRSAGANVDSWYNSVRPAMWIEL